MDQREPALGDEEEKYENIIINKVDGLPNLHPNYQQLELEFEEDKDRTNTRRMRVNYNLPSAAAHARIQLHQAKFGDTNINCYFAQPVTPIDIEDRHLHPPALTKQFLISPPASPPVGWEPRPEDEPLVNHDLLAAIANLSPGGAHELHPGGSGQPGIVVHVCENSSENPIKKLPIQHTRCPEH
ncbi:hypothetical protein G9C98_003400 [Cotesia typhae]|uniref:Protein sarah n=1 Tax=Cotesia typhae TaxID=2053667 RepID=A0A8J5VAM5_9HYME|nr:hypothetical protein G9C98_003400 [Cotesia typhae]